jgi:phage terminase large subunit-like protein
MYEFDEAAADRAVSFIEDFITHTKGEMAMKKMYLEKWQKDDIIRPLFGWKHKDTGLRKYRTCYVEIPRKNGKSTLAAAIALYILFADNERGAEVYSCAGDRSQASIIFNIAKSMVENSSELTKRAQVYRASIVNPSKGNTYKALSADAKLQHGHNAHAILFDELHTQPNRELWDTMKTSTGARSQPLLIALTTAGASKTDGNICWEIHDYSVKVRDGVITDEAFLPVIYCADDDDDILSEETWSKANPNYGISVKKDYIKAEAKLASELPSYENAFRRLHLNQWTTNETKWLSDKQWMDCDKPLDTDFLLGRECYGGLDLASTRDLSALTLVFPMDDGSIHVLPFYWLPEITATERGRKDKVPYVEWARQGYIQLTEGDVQDYDYIRHTINELALKYRIVSISFDRWNSSQLVNNLTDDGANLSPFGQGYASMSAPTKDLEKMVLKKNVVHGGNPVLRWQVQNVQLRTDPAGNVKIDKAKSSEKVDGVVSLVMGIGEWMTNDTGTSIYDQRGIIGI